MAQAFRQLRVHRDRDIVWTVDQVFPGESQYCPAGEHEPVLSGPVVLKPVAISVVCAPIHLNDQPSRSEFEVDDADQSVVVIEPPVRLPSLNSRCAQDSVKYPLRLGMCSAHCFLGHRPKLTQTPMASQTGCRVCK